ncbi:sigma-70 family RNA polymerase sigma factor [Rufibacter immobilis]|uniref:Sigma-70 family RNA polymerase sigma factor n=1 Tax=Rufibacter immobilis TaxID=1348778 RepID=A0A3M9N431_9BACT|nr:sigma-70 family RNA polymerase sigma factor [Rufibacter immobilis]RNI32496.1 sigma-70 family RNA polymerase sigma factor [Rufibacter immobilis]
MDLQEFKTKVLPSKQKLYRLALFMLQNKEEAEDILQDVFLKLWTNKHKLHAYASIEAFAMSITKNLCLDKLKAKKNKQMVDVTDMELNSGEQTPYQRYELADQVHKVQELVKELPEQQQLILHLRDVEGYSYEEVEQVTGMNVNAIRVTLSRARKSVRDGLLKMENYAL